MNILAEKLKPGMVIDWYSHGEIPEMATLISIELKGNDAFLTCTNKLIRNGQPFTVRKYRCEPVPVWTIKNEIEKLK